MSRLRTAYIRSQLLPSIIRGGVQKSMREYLDIRIQESTITPVDQAGRELLLAKASHSQAALSLMSREDSRYSDGRSLTGR